MLTAKPGQLKIALFQMYRSQQRAAAGCRTRCTAHGRHSMSHSDLHCLQARMSGQPCLCDELLWSCADVLRLWSGCTLVAHAWQLVGGVELHAQLHVEQMQRWVYLLGDRYHRELCSACRQILIWQVCNAVLLCWH
jgi:hypothetical protein